MKKIALITGAAHRIGAAIARLLHEEGMDLVVHYRSSKAPAFALKKELEQKRPESVMLLPADLQDIGRFPELIGHIRGERGRLDLLVNNASSFYATPVDRASEQAWDDLVGTNMKAPYFLSLAAAPLLRESGGSIVNLVDIHAERPLEGHSIYSMAKAGSVMMVKSLARELGPEIRVNGVAPGAILWPEKEISDEMKEQILFRTVLEQAGRPEDIARTVLFLAKDAGYVTGQIITVDGGRSVQQ